MDDIVEGALRAFITKEISRALGEEYLDVYLPPPAADILDLVRFIVDKWLGIFADSDAVANKRPFFKDALKSLRTQPRDSHLLQLILVEIGCPGKAAALANGYNNINNNTKAKNKKNKKRDALREAEAYGGAPAASSSSNRNNNSISSSSTISKTSLIHTTTTTTSSSSGVGALASTTTNALDADGDMKMDTIIPDIDEGGTTSTTGVYLLSSGTTTTTTDSSAVLLRQAGDNDTTTTTTRDSAMVDVEVDRGYNYYSGGGDNYSKIVVVLDGANIGWRYGRTKFSMIGVAAAVAHYQCLESVVTCRVIVVLPEGLCDSSNSNTNTTPEEKETVNWINSLQDNTNDTQLIATPDNDYDDAYVTHLARRLSAIIVSNDKFRDQIYQAAAEDNINKNTSSTAAEEWRQYLAKCRCSFAFLGKRFVPNPAFDIRRGAAFARKYSLYPD